MTKSISNALRAFALATLLTPTLTFASAAGDPTVLPGSTQVGQPGMGGDMYTQAMTQLGLFNVHRDDCVTASEVFVEVYTDDNSVQFGFCIDKNEHAAGSVNWENARDECMEDGKRLPEPGEMLQALNTVAVSLNDDGEDYEWSSNFYNTMAISTTSSVCAALIYNSSRGGCGYIGSATSQVSSFPFRCVR